jgi:acyl transferase domain-containing protein
VPTEPVQLRRDIAHTLALHREHLPWRTFAITNGAESPEFSAPAKAPSATPRLNFVFSGQGAQWAGMGAKLIADFPAVRDDFEKMEQALSNLDAEIKPSWKLRGIFFLEAFSFVLD